MIRVNWRPPAVAGYYKIRKILFFTVCDVCLTGQVCDINDGRCCEANDSMCQICPPYHIQTADGCEYCGSCEERLFRRVDRLLGNYSTGGGDGVATDKSKKRLDKTEIDVNKYVLQTGFNSNFA